MDAQIKEELLSIRLDGLDVKKVQKHPRSTELVKATNERLKELESDFQLDSDLAEFTLYTFPLLKSFELNSFKLFFDVWAFIFDDHLDNYPEEYDKWSKIIKEKTCSGSGRWEELFRAIIGMARKAIPNEQSLDELMSLTNDLIMNSRSEIERVKKAQAKISDEDYIKLRITDVGSLQQFFFIKIDSGLEVTDELRADKNWIEFEQNVAKHLLIMNDLFSLKREVKNDVGMWNYVYIKMRNTGLSAQDAVEQIFEEGKTAEKLAHHHGHILKEKNIQGMNEYVDQMIATMYGNLYWSTICKRYNDI